MLLHPLAAEQQVIAAPAWRAVEFGPLIHRHVRRIVHIGLQPRRILAQHGGQFGLDRRRLGFESLDPGEILSVVELELRQAGIVELDRLLVVDAPLAGQIVDEGVEATGGRRAADAQVAQTVLQRPTEGGFVVGENLPGALGRRSQLRRQLIHRRDLGQGDAIGSPGIMRSAHFLQQRGLHQQRDKPSRVDGEGRVDGAQRRRQIAEGAAAGRQVHEQREVARRQARRLLQQ